jgi:L-alanine-DL-glutamate epimerase-like enolase superfamily enzyme
MQISHVEVTPVELSLRIPYRCAHVDRVDSITAVFVRVETREGHTAWGCTAVDPAHSPDAREEVIRACRACADRARDLNPLNTEYALAELSAVAGDTRSALCAFDLAFYDLLCLAADMPLYRLLGGYRQRIQTSITIGLASVAETVEMARDRARQGFRVLKIKGGLDPQEDVRRIRAVHRALPHITLRLDADQSYTIQQALDVARTLNEPDAPLVLEMLEQPTPAGDLDALGQVSQLSPIPILADESVKGPASAIEIAGRRAADGMSVKLATCGGIRCARQIDSIAQAARLATMVGCVHEPALLVSAGLALALSSPNVQYCDLDGHFDLVGDPSLPQFGLQEGWFTAPDLPGIGCTAEL